MKQTVLLTLAFILLVDAHNYLMSPISRGDQFHTQTGCRFGGEGNPTCAGPCDRKVGKSVVGPISITRGATIDVQWYRHNHPGGFIRFAWASTATSDVHASFDAGVDLFTCKDIGGCGPAAGSSAEGGEANGLPCAATITVPLWLSNGAWTLQWAYFGGYYNAGDYYACVDYTITGGPTGTQNAAVFRGGDATYPNQPICRFYSTDALHVCTVEPCTNGTYPAGARAGPVKGFSSDGVQTTGVRTTGAQTTARQTTGVQTTARQTTGVRTTSVQTTAKQTTGVKTTGVKTTGVKTTGAKATTGVRTTGVQTGVQTTATQTTGVPQVVTTGVLSDSCSGNENRCVVENGDSYQTCFNGQYAAPQKCQTSLVCKSSPSSNRAYCVRPTDIVRDDGSIASPASFLQPVSIFIVLLLVTYLLL